MRMKDHWCFMVSTILCYRTKVQTRLPTVLQYKDFLCEELRWIELIICRKGETPVTRQIPYSVATQVYAKKHSNALSFLPLGPWKWISLFFFFFLKCFIQICLAQQMDAYWFCLSLQFCHNRVRFFTGDCLVLRYRRGQENNTTFLRT